MSCVSLLLILLTGPASAVPAAPVLASPTVSVAATVVVLELDHRERRPPRRIRRTPPPHRRPLRDGSLDKPRRRRSRIENGEVSPVLTGRMLTGHALVVLYDARLGRSLPRVPLTLLLAGTRSAATRNPPPALLA